MTRIDDRINRRTALVQLTAATMLAAGAAKAKGLVHLAASGETSWHGFAEAIVGLMPEDGRKCRTVEAIRTDEYPTPTKRPAYSVLSCDKLKRTFGLGLPDWRESLEQVLEKP